MRRRSHAALFVLLAWGVLLSQCSLEEGGIAPGESVETGAPEATAPQPDVQTGPEGSVDAPVGEETSTVDGGDAEAGDAANDEGGPVDAGPEADTNPADAGSDTNIDDAGTPGTILSIEGRPAFSGDFTDDTDQGLAANGTGDRVFALQVVGPINGIIIAATNPGGVISNGGPQWDTLVGTDPIPATCSSFASGDQTRILAVRENTTTLNDINGRVSIGAGPHALLLYGDPTNAAFSSGQNFRICVRTGTAWHQAGFEWP